MICILTNKWIESIGWFYTCQLNIYINDYGKIMEWWNNDEYINIESEDSYDHLVKTNGRWGFVSCQWVIILKEGSVFLFVSRCLIQQTKNAMCVRQWIQKHNRQHQNKWQFPSHDSALRTGLSFHYCFIFLGN